MGTLAKSLTMDIREEARRIPYYPTNNPTQGENERNLLAIKGTEAYPMLKRGEISIEEYRDVIARLQSQGDFSFTVEG